MRIFLLTPIYATTTEGVGATPVVHYFTREWVRMGHEVTVFHIVAKFPRVLYWIGKHFQHQLNTRLGMLVPIHSPIDEEYVADGVVVHKKCFKKMVPHSLYKRSQLEKILKFVSCECEGQGMPDWFIGHWDNPQLELLNMLKAKYGIPTCLVFHQNDFDLENKFGSDAKRMLSNIDVIGFRSLVAESKYCEKYGKPRRSFIAYSGVSDTFLAAGLLNERIVKQPVKNYIFVGSLIARKHPAAIVTALVNAYPEGDFSVTYIGDGAEKESVEKECKRLNCQDSVRFTGRIGRGEVINYLKQADVFVMVSEGEIFGLVYLEAMALGVIPIGSTNEGIDGVIKHGINGFLCEAGNVEKLANVLKTIKSMPLEQVESIARNAKKTANEYSDKGVAEKYLDVLKTK